MGKQPAFMFYPGDWRRDTQVQMASMETRGVWFEMLCCMWDAPERGKIEGTITELSRLIGCEEEVFLRTLSEINRLKIGDVTNCNGFVTVCNRRMAREQKERDNTKFRVRKFRGVTEMYGECNKNVTAHLSSSSSFSSSISVKKDIKKRIKKDNISSEAQEILSYLNQKSGSNFTSIGLIQERLNAGATVEQCKKVIDIKWNDPDFKKKYFNHTTLFREDNFDKYLNQKDTTTRKLCDKAELYGKDRDYASMPGMEFDEMEDTE